MILRDAFPQEIDRILEGTHALWSDGLDPPSYRDYIATLMNSSWARQGSYRFLALVDEPSGELLAGAKLYRFAARLGRRAVSVGGIGAVFTLPPFRRRGYAAELISRAHDIMSERGDAFSLLFSEIGASYYAGLGYRELPAHAAVLMVPPDGPAPPALCRMHRRELEIVAGIREKEDAAASFALVRDGAYWKYLLARASYPTLWLGRERWESRLMLAQDGGYLWSLFGRAHGGTGAKLLEAGEMEAGSVLPGLLEDLFAECRRRGVDQVEAWLPPSLAARDPRLSGPQARIIQPPPVAPMWFPLEVDSAEDSDRHRASVIFHQSDVF